MPVQDLLWKSRRHFRKSLKGGSLNQREEPEPSCLWGKGGFRLWEGEEQRGWHWGEVSLGRRKGRRKKHGIWWLL